MGKTFKHFQIIVMEQIYSIGQNNVCNSSCSYEAYVFWSLINDHWSLNLSWVKCNYYTRMPQLLS